jgi:site-specific recombinase XerD
MLLICFCVVAVLTYQATVQAERRAGRKPVPVEEWSAEYVQGLQDRWPDLLQLDLAQSTHRSYSWHVEQYKRLCRAMGAQEMPTAQLLAQFVVGRAQHGYARSTIELGVYAVSSWALDLGVEGLAAELVVRRAMKVAAKLAVPLVGQKLPLDRGDLRKVVSLLQQWGDEDFIGVRDRALFLVGWTGMFRSSELVGIHWEDVKVCGQGLLLFIPRSKTDQAGEGAWVFIARCGEAELCPVGALQRLQRFAVKGEGGLPEGPVFTGWPRERHGLRKSTVGMRLKKALQAAAVRGWKQYAAHSLRRGGATWAVNHEVAVRQVMVMGRWRSDVVRQYLYHTPSQLWAASRQQQQG